MYVIMKMIDKQISEISLPITVRWKKENPILMIIKYTFKSPESLII